MRTRIRYSQNFLKDSSLVKSLIEKSSINKEDVVYEIGAGQGIITEELLKRSGKVVAFEIDENFFHKLSRRFQYEKAVELRRGNFLDHHLPSQPYKVFSNIPFNITSTIVKKLTQADNPPEDAYLIVQKEAANKFIGKPEDRLNSLLSILIKSQFNIAISYKFDPNDFFPRPSVEVVVLRIQKLKEPLISQHDSQAFFDLVTFAYSQFQPNILKGLNIVINQEKLIKTANTEGFSTSSKPSQLELKDWVAIFQVFKDQSNEKQKNRVSGAYRNLQKQQDNLQKVNRTRVDKNWRKFSK